jgi:hypothetical protein
MVHWAGAVLPCDCFAMQHLCGGQHLNLLLQLLSQLLLLLLLLLLFLWLCLTGVST